MRKRNTILLLILSSIANDIFAQQGIAFLNTAESLIESEFTIEQNDVVLPFELDRGMIYVDAKVDDKQGQFILDTGAPSLVLNEKPRPTDNNPYTAQSCSAEVNIGLKQIEHFSWAGGQMEALEAITLDLSHLESARKARVDGMIGYDILKKNTLLLDFDKETLALIRPRSWKKWSENPPVASIPFNLVGHLPVVEVELNGKLVRLGVDTGAASNLMSEEVAQSLNQDVAHQETMAEIQGLDQEVKRAPVRQYEFSAGKNKSFSSKFMLLDLSHLNKDAAFSLDGLLGYPFLSQYIVAIDYHRQILLLWEK